MSRELRILFVEDSAPDAELEQRELRRGGLIFTAKRVESREDLVRALNEFEPDLIISDYSLPSMDGPSALEIAQEIRPDVPFIFVSGTIGEERAVESLKKGAVDYVVKDRLASLHFKVSRALKDAEERKERRSLEEQLQRAQKMEAVGRLAAGVAHDFNNLLTVIEGYTQMMLDGTAPDHPRRTDLTEVLRACHRATSLTQQLLAFGRRQIIAPRIMNLNAIVAGIENMLRRVIGEDVELATSLDPALANVRADSGQVEQVIMNLAINARDAMPDGGTLTLKTVNVELDEAHARQFPGSAAGPHVMLSVGDTGIGMDGQIMAHIFEPFFTTKEAGKGTGLGLSTVYGIVQQSGGHISLESAPGKGTTFNCYFPRADESVETVETKGAPRHISAGARTLLLVEDEEAVRSLVSRVLERHGFTVLQAGDGEEALRLIRTHEGDIDVLITDVVMPRLGGKELASHLSELRPNTRILYTSGYTDQANSLGGAPGSGAQFLQKPFSPSELLRAVHEILTEEP